MPSPSGSTHRRSMTLASRCAECAIDHYHRFLPSNTGGKPQAGREWTVYAAIVASRRRGEQIRSAAAATSQTGRDGNGDADQESELWVVSCATGSKCTSIRSIVSSLPSAKTGLGDSDFGNSGKKDHSSKMTNPRQVEELDDDAICQCYNGMVLKDSHAETLTRRGLVACLWDEIECSLKHIQRKTMSERDVRKVTEAPRERALLEICDAPPDQDGPCSVTFRLKHNISLHMYVSDSPCGDSTIYEIRKKATQQSAEDAIEMGETELNFTGAKIVLSSDKQHASNDSNISSILTCTNGENATDCSKPQPAVTVGREHTQQLGALRIKSSRSNIPPELRSRSMCCSDKLVRWGVFGIQGSLLSSFIPTPICLSSICVSKDPRSVDGGQLVALERAVRMRIAKALEEAPRNQDLRMRPPDVAVVALAFESSKSATDYRSFLAQNNHRKRTAEEVCSTCVTGRKRQKVEDRNKVSSGNDDVPERKTDHSSGPNRATKKESASGVSINWHQCCNTEKDVKKATEITVGATGLKRGKKPKRPKNVLGAASRLCRFNLLQRCLRSNAVKESLQGDDSHATCSQPVERVRYSQYKQRMGQEIDDTYFQGPLKDWIRSGKDDDFIIPQTNLY